MKKKPRKETCPYCGGRRIEQEGVTGEGIPYKYNYCTHCGEKLVDLDQLHEVAEKYRHIKKYTAKVSRWGDSVAIRIPKALAKQYNIRPKQDVQLVPDNKIIKIVA